MLWLARCGLEDLDGLSSMNNLHELYLAYNEIYDISPCSMLEHLKILDLEGYVWEFYTQKLIPTDEMRYSRGVRKP